MDWFLYDKGLRHERVNQIKYSMHMLHSFNTLMPGGNKKTTHT